MLNANEMARRRDEVKRHLEAAFRTGVLPGAMVDTSRGIDAHGAWLTVRVTARGRPVELSRVVQVWDPSGASPSPESEATFLLAALIETIETSHHGAASPDSQ